MNRYIMFGAGGIGSNFISPALAYLDAYHSNRGELWQFDIVDGDEFEAKNLVRQLFEPEMIGKNKAEALASMFDRYPVNPVPKFAGMLELSSLLSDGCVVFIGVDNYSLRSLVERRATQLDNVVVINGGNEYHDGSVQLWVRENGENKTPRISYGHPEIAYSESEDRTRMSCAQIAQIPGGEQLIITNMAVANNMLAALWRYHEGSWQDGWTELYFDLKKGENVPVNMRTRMNWAR